MSTTNHGKWTLYAKPATALALPPVDLHDKAELKRRSEMPPNVVSHVTPDNIVYARNADGVDWYDYLDTNPFTEGSTVVLVDDNQIVLDAAQDASRLFPADLTVIETTDTAEPLAKLVNRKFDQGRFDEVPLDKRPIATMQDLKTALLAIEQRLAKLEQK